MSDEFPHGDAKLEVDVIDSLEIDEDGYPSEPVLDRIRALKDAEPREVWRFMRRDFVALALDLTYGRCEAMASEEPGRMRIEFATGGWSGCEDFIEAVLSVPLLRLMYYAEWHRGGLHVFEVPLEMAQPTATSRPPDMGQEAPAPPRDGG